MAEQRRDEILQSVGRRLRQLRTDKGLSQEGLAATAGLDRTYIGGIERGERNVAVLNLVKLARALGVAPKELLSNL